MRQKLLTALHQILTTTIANRRFYFSRLVGFRSEIALRAYLAHKGEEPLDGGQFLFPHTGMDTCGHELVYVTVSGRDKSSYTDLYATLASIPIVKRLYFVSYSHMSTWQHRIFRAKDADNSHVDILIPAPCFRYHVFDCGSFQNCDEASVLDHFEKKTRVSYASQKQNTLGYLSQYPASAIESVYANRFFLDVSLGEYKKGMIDCDGVLKRSGQYWLLESKEKDVGGSNDAGYFGWDSRRFAWYLYLQNCCSLKTLYIIRQVNNQTERRFVDWRYVDIEGFASWASWLSESGGGGGSGTITAPLAAFSRLSSLFGEN